jgi:23S rRNA (guanine745-N1)-methyltransferase
MEPLARPIPVIPVPLACPVRGCGFTLERSGNSYRCAKGHSFDIARSGYVNLLQPQERRSKHPGDTAAAIAGRRALHEGGWTGPFREALLDLAQASAVDTVLDVGCGEGFYLGSLQGEAQCAASGIDISVPAIEAAARRYPACQWIVGNADRSLPYPDGTFTLALSITARMASSGIRRVLRDSGRLIVAIPAPEDLIELRGNPRDRDQRTALAFAGHFVLTGQRRVTTIADLDAATLAALRHAIYRPAARPGPGGPSAPARVTMSLDFLTFAPRLS